MQFGSSSDVGQPARTVWQIISEDSEWESLTSEERGTEVELHRSTGGRVQVKARIVRDRGRVAEIRFEKVTGRAGRDATIEQLLSLDHEASKRLMELCITLQGIDPEGAETQKIEEGLLSALLADPEVLAAVYSHDPQRFSAIIKADVTAEDVVAIAARRNTVDHFEHLLNDPALFEAERGGKSSEAVWQHFFEENPWLLGVGLSGQLLTSWDENRLEKLVAGSSVADVGKRADALLATTGIVRSLVFAEIKRHDDPLLDTSEYRSGTWAPSRAVVGGVAQALVTAARARDDLGTWLAAKDHAGFTTGEQVFAGSPRSFLILGTLKSLTNGDRMHPDMVRSFELYRRSTVLPEIVTYDEVLARARWSLDLLEREPMYNGSAD
ncbi:DUF4263 domain-containing protein (plasmid) [Arthrobacter agilis]|uniref:Shedu immune nuclease family protein n=1 Tax=Arthrobacter agilis TaxID=37921 RepID=UPI002365CF18|nr:Shedu immune nuclease family protein [Arthrobacter agilis]WDF35079.1 DUF4263 domain-containing protein [Arthrobacter agilis]